jgi:hypothetical protein
MTIDFYEVKSQNWNTVSEQPLLKYALSDFNWHSDVYTHFLRVDFCSEKIFGPSPASGYWTILKFEASKVYHDRIENSANSSASVGSIM